MAKQPKQVPLAKQFPDLAPKKRMVDRYSPTGRDEMITDRDGAYTTYGAYRALEVEYANRVVAQKIAENELAATKRMVEKAQTEADTQRRYYEIATNSAQSLQRDIAGLRNRLDAADQRERELEQKIFVLESAAYTAKDEHTKEIARLRSDIRAWEQRTASLRERYRGMSDAVRLFGIGSPPEDQ